MGFLYNITIYVYLLLIHLAAYFNGKAGLWVKGRRGQFNRLAEDFKDHPRVAWFHAASLGEFEQGRPVMEAFREKFPDTRILLTFFSPSGYEVRKNYSGADYIHYLPMDTPGNVRKFIRLVNPVAAIFVKYEFWFNYLDILSRKKIPTYVISAIFRPDQHFFKWYGSWFRRQLKKISHFFVQDENSAALLQSIGIQHVLVSGDTRFDRVATIAEQKKDYPLIEAFAKGKQVLLAGSSWPPDENLILKLLNSTNENLNVIIAPHEIHEERINDILSRFAAYKPMRFSQAGKQDISDSRILVIDGMGFLSSLYQYCNVALIGGGFGKGIHNILEAVTYGKPVLFGPNYEKFAEARKLIDLKGAFVVEENNFKDIVNQLFTDIDTYQTASATCKKYIADNTGASSIIIENLRMK